MRFVCPDGLAATVCFIRLEANVNAVGFFALSQIVRADRVNAQSLPVDVGKRLIIVKPVVDDHVPVARIGRVADV